MRFLLLFVTLTAALSWAPDSFKGTWTSSRNSVSGDIRIVLEGEGALTFTIEGYEIKAKVTEWNVSQNYGEERKFRLTYKFALQDTPLISYAQGTIKAGKLEGKYETKAEADKSAVDQGTFSGSSEK